MKIEAKIVLKYESKEKARAVASAVSPDNVNYQELSIRTFDDGCQVVTLIGCKGKIGTFITTIDDLLRCLTVAEKTINSVKENSIV